jgi:hypothetical protein
MGLWTRWTVPWWAVLFVSLGYVSNEAVMALPSLFADRLQRRIALLLIVAGLTGLLSTFVYADRQNFEHKPFREVAGWLKQNSAQDESVLLEPIGLIGYLSGLYVYDYTGLVTPKITEMRRSYSYCNRWFIDFVKQNRPIYVVLRSTELEKNEFIHAGYSDGIFTVDEKSWFERSYGKIFESNSSGKEHQLEMFRIKNPQRLPTRESVAE